jgi:hypothetical protein
MISLESVAARLSQRITAGTYPGVLAGLIPVDAALSKLAKHSYLMYRLWDRYADLTNPRFDGNRSGVGGSADPEMLAQLRRDGFALTENVFPDPLLSEGRAFVMSLYERARPRIDSCDPDQVTRWDSQGFAHQFYPRVGKFRVFFTLDQRGQVPKLLSDFMDLPRIHVLAEEYFGTTQVLAGLPYMMAEVQLPAPHVETWHIDCLRPTLKAFLNLDTVEEKHGPLRVIPGSQEKTEEKHRLYYRVIRGGEAAAYFYPEEDKLFDPRARSMVAPANSVCVFDTRALHAGSMVREGVRVVLVSGYRPRFTTRINPRMFRNPSPAKMPWERRGGDDGRD